MNIASPWDHRVYEEKGKKIDEYHNLKREIGKIWGIKQREVVPVVVDALGAVSKRLNTLLDKLGITIGKGSLQKTALLGTATTLRKLLER